MTEILLIHGPCSFTRSTWTAGNITKAGLLRAILDWLLNAKENEIIVLYCVGSLTDSPTILRDLELINNRVIVVSLNGVKSRYPTIYSRWCAVGLWAAIVQFGAGCGKESFCPAVDRRCMYIFFRNESSHSVIPPRCGFAASHPRLMDTCASHRDAQPTHFTSITRAFLLECRLGHSTCPKTPAAATLCRCPGASKSAIGNSSSSFESRAWGCKSDSPANRLDKSRLFASLRS
ncbi:hypothetical protein PC129_g5062 [Phytophthora cactorum]|uniref:Uncharacterized protein n=1 Tax=Phytophthora cactorum TaxID=29920 RepID=A0A8T1IJ37_9STRA|nr:hypothetical protein PC129_g5062 [Phytophthora cactorum]